MPNRAYVVNPQYEETPDGPVYTGSEVATQNSALDHDGSYRGWQDDFTPDEQGRMQYEPEVVDDSEDNSTSFDFTDYGHTFRDSIGAKNYDAVTAYASEYLDDALTDKFNEAVDTGDVDRFHELFEMFQKAFEESGEGQQAEAVEQEPEEELSDDESTQFAQVLDDLVEQQPGGMEQAYGWLEAAQQWKEQDPVLSAVCQATASFHDGSAESAEALIDELTAKFTPRQLAKAYKTIYGS